MLRQRWIVLCYHAAVWHDLAPFPLKELRYETHPHHP
jgi:hypothetical protein